MNNTSVFTTAWWATVITIVSTAIVGVVAIVQPGVSLPPWVAGLGATISPVLSLISLGIYHLFHHKTTTALAQIEAATVHQVVHNNSPTF